MMARKGGKKIICFNYRKPGHIMAECPDFKNKISSSMKQKKWFVKKAFKATWDSESESEDEVDTANTCFMANTPKVTFKPSYDDIEKSKEELLQAFIELSENYDSKKKDCLKLKKGKRNA